MARRYVLYRNKLLNIINASNFYYYFINWHKSVEYRVEKWRTLELEGEKSGEHQLKKVGNVKHYSL